MFRKYFKSCSVVDNMKKIGLSGYDFSAAYSNTAVDDILDIGRYLMKKNDIV